MIEESIEEYSNVKELINRIVSDFTMDSNDYFLYTKTYSIYQRSITNDITFVKWRDMNILDDDLEDVTDVNFGVLTLGSVCGGGTLKLYISIMNERLSLDLVCNPLNGSLKTYKVPLLQVFVCINVVIEVCQLDANALELDMLRDNGFPDWFLKAVCRYDGFNGNLFELLHDSIDIRV
jgi:hypothetical protein